MIDSPSPYLPPNLSVHVIAVIGFVCGVILWQLRIIRAEPEWIIYGAAAVSGTVTSWKVNVASISLSLSLSLSVSLFPPTPHTPSFPSFTLRKMTDYSLRFRSDLLLLVCSPGWFLYRMSMRVYIYIYIYFSLLLLLFCLGRAGRSSCDTYRYPVDSCSVGKWMLDSEGSTTSPVWL